MKILMMGLTSSGKTYQSKRIAEHFHLKYVSGSSLLLHKLSQGEDMVRHFWLEEKGKELDERRDATSTDKHVDEILLNKARTCDNVIFDSWTLPWLYDNDDAVRIYLNPTTNARAQMAFCSKQDKHFTTDELRKRITEKDECSRCRFLAMYGFDIFDKSPFHLVFDNSNLQPDETTDKIIDWLQQSFNNR